MSCRKQKLCKAKVAEVIFCILLNKKYSCLLVESKREFCYKYMSVSQTQAYLGATRPRVGICKPRLDALTCKYVNINTSSIANLGHRTPSWQCRRGDASPPGWLAFETPTNCSPSNTLSQLVREVSFIYVLVCSPTLFYINLQQY